MLSKKAKTDAEEDVDVSNQVRSFEPLLGTHHASPMGRTNHTRVADLGGHESVGMAQQHLHAGSGRQLHGAMRCLLAACALTIRNLV